MRGRKPLPSNVIELRGGTRHTHRPPNKFEPKPEPKAPSCPKHLDEEAREEWRRVSKELASLGLLTRLDKAVFAMYCTSYSTWKNATERLAKSGMITFVGKIKKEVNKKGKVIREGNPGIPRINPYFKIQKESQIQMLKCLVEMGMSPSSRSRIKVQPKPKEDPADKFLKEGTTGREGN